MESLSRIDNIAERFNRPVYTRPAITSVAILTSGDYLGLWDRFYWTMHMRSNPTFYVNTLNGFLNAASDDDKPAVAQEIRHFLDIEQVKNGFEEAPKDCGLFMLNTRVDRILKPQTPNPAQAAAVRLIA